VQRDKLSSVHPSNKQSPGSMHKRNHTTRMPENSFLKKEVLITNSIFHIMTTKEISAFYDKNYLLSDPIIISKQMKKQVYIFYKKGRESETK